MKKLILICILIVLLGLISAKPIPYPVDSPDYAAYKTSLIGQASGQKQANNPQSRQGLIPLAYQQQPRNGLLIPRDGSFTMAIAGADDNYTEALNLPFSFDFYGGSQTQFYINNNGNISFGSPYSTYSSSGFPIDEFPMLAAFWADVDTRPELSGKVYYKIEPSRVTVIWDGVGYFANHTDLLNTFEVIFTNGLDPLIGIGNNVAFSYGDMQWTTGSASGGSNGFGGTPATVGLNKGDGIHYGLIGRFDHAGTDYNGPGGAPSGISYLDNQLFTFSTMLDNAIPPIFTGVPTADIILHAGESTSIQITALSPNPLNSVDAIVQHDFSSGFSSTVVSGNPCQIDISVEASSANLGMHQIQVIATDNGVPVQSSTASFNIRILSRSEYVLAVNQTPPSVSIIDENSGVAGGPYLNGQLGTGNLLDGVVAPNGQFALLSNFDDYTVHHIDLSNPFSPTLVGSYNTGFAPEDIALSYDGRFAVVADGGNSTMLAVIDLQSRTTVQTVNIYPRHAQGVSLSIDGKVLVNDADQGKVYQYQLNPLTGILTDTGAWLAVPDPSNVAIHPTGETAVITNFNGGETQVIRLNPDGSLVQIQSLATGNAQCSAYSADGSSLAIITIGSPVSVRLYTVQEDGSLVLQTAFNLPDYTDTGFYGVDTITFNSAKTRLYAGKITNGSTSGLKVIDLNTGLVSVLSTDSTAGVALGNIPLKAQFKAIISNLQLSSQVQFKQFSTGGPESYYWDFGNDQSSSLPNPEVVYAEPGVYTVSLTVFRGSYSHTAYQAVQVMFDPNVHLTLAGSPYYFSSNIIIQPGQSLTIDSGVVLNFAADTGLTVLGQLSATGATFNGSETLGWKGIVISGNAPVVFDNCNIYNAIQALKLQDQSFTLNNLLISKTQLFTNELGLWVVGASNMILNNVQINGYLRGIVFNNEELRTTTSASLSNVRIRNSSSSVRPDNRGLEVMGAVGLSLNDVLVEEYDEGIYWDGQGATYGRTTPSLSNVRIRNSSSSVRTQTFGLKMIDVSSITAIGDTIEGYLTGFSLQTTGNYRTTTSASLSNVRIRNSSSSVRTPTIGIDFRGSIAVSFSELDILDSNTGVYYEGDGQPFERTTPSLSNVRIRNSSSSVREPVNGIVLKNLAAVNLFQNTIYPALTETGNAAGVAINLQNVAASNVQQNTIWGFETGLELQSSASSFDSNIIWTNGSELPQPIVNTGGSLVVSNSCISYSGGVFPGQGNMDRDPLFVSPQSGNFYLKPRSPLRESAIGAYAFDYDAISAVRTYQMHPAWNLMGIPYLTQPGQNSPVSIFADDLNPFYVAPTYTSIVQMNPTAVSDSLGHLSYSYTGNYNVPSSIVPGRGYWVRNPYANPTPVDIYGLLDDGNYRIELAGSMNPNNGWFLLGNPYDRPLNFLDGSIASAPGAMIPSWAYVYSYDANNYLLVDANPANDAEEGNASEIPAWNGFFVKANASTDELYLNYPAAAAAPRNNSLIADGSLHPASEALPDWQLELAASTSGNSDAITLGVSASASDGCDPMDVPELPNAPFVLPKGLELSVVNNDWEQNPGHYSRDIRNKQGRSWSWNLLLNLENLLTDGKFSGVIKLDTHSRLPQGYRYALINPQTGQSSDLSSEVMLLELNLDATGEGSPWLIPLILEVSGNGMSEALETRGIISSSNYPNPFNPETTIRYSLGMDSPVSLEIYNLKGQLVKRLVNQTQSAGSHSVVWNGTDSQGLGVASGFYFYRIKAGGEQLSRKILLMK